MGKSLEINAPNGSGIYDEGRMEVWLAQPGDVSVKTGGSMDVRLHGETTEFNLEWQDNGAEDRATIYIDSDAHVNSFDIKAGGQEIFCNAGELPRGDNADLSVTISDAYEVALDHAKNAGGDVVFDIEAEGIVHLGGATADNGDVSVTVKADTVTYGYGTPNFTVSGNNVDIDYSGVAHDALAEEIIDFFAGAPPGTVISANDAITYSGAAGTDIISVMKLGGADINTGTGEDFVAFNAEYGDYGIGMGQTAIARLTLDSAEADHVMVAGSSNGNLAILIDGWTPGNAIQVNTTAGNDQAAVEQLLQDCGLECDEEVLDALGRDGQACHDGTAYALSSDVTGSLTLVAVDGVADITGVFEEIA